MKSVTEKQYEHELLFSLLNDLANVLLRDHVRPHGWQLDEEPGWQAEFIWAYLPQIAKELPLREATVSPRQLEPADVRVSWDADRVRVPAERFLSHFLRSAVDAERLASEALVDEPDHVRRVREQVVQDGYWMEF